MIHGRLALWLRLIRFWDGGFRFSDLPGGASGALRAGPGPSRSNQAPWQGHQSARLLLEPLEERSHPGQTAGVLGLGIMGTGLGLVDRELAPQAPASSQPTLMRSDAPRLASSNSSYLVSLSSTIRGTEDAPLNESRPASETPQHGSKSGEDHASSGTGPDLTDDPLADPLASEWTKPQSAGNFGGADSTPGRTTGLPEAGSAGTHSPDIHPSSASAGGAASHSPASDSANQAGSASAPAAPPAAKSASNAIVAPAIQSVSPSPTITAGAAGATTPGQPAHSAAAKAGAPGGVALSSGSVVGASTSQPKADAGPSTSVASQHPAALAKVKPHPFSNSSGINGTGQNFTTQEGVNWTGTLVSGFTDVSGETYGKGNESESYSASIDWGDNSSGSGIISGNNVNGSHTYLDPGTYNLTVIIIDEDGSASGTFGCQASVTEAPLSASAKTISVVENASFNGAVASFSDGGSQATGADLTATVAWPDGPVAGTITPNNQGGYDVTSSHSSFGDEVSDRTVTVTISDDGGGPSTSVNSTLKVTDAPVTGANSVSPFGAKAGVPIQGQLGIFTDTNPQSSPGDFSGSTINWGDGSTSAAQIGGGGATNPDGSTTYTVSGSHTYDGSVSNPTVTVHIVDDGGQHADLTTSVTVSGNPDLPPAGTPLEPPSTPPDSSQDTGGGGTDWWETSNGSDSNTADSFDPTANENTSDQNNCSCKDPQQEDPNADGQGSAGQYSSDPIRYFDGAVKLSSTDIESEGFGFHWGQSRYWSNMPGYSASGVNGNGWVVTQLPYLRQTASGTTIVVITNGVDARYFDQVGSSTTYTPRLYLQETLTHDTTNNQFILTDTVGDTIRFNDLTSTLPANQQGQFQSLTDPAGNVTGVVSRTTDGKPTEVQRTTNQSGVVTTESYLYTYIGSGTNAGLLSNVTLRRQVNGGAWAIARQVNYTYYDGSQAHGNAGDLMTAIVLGSAGNTINTDYYRYYTPADSGANGPGYVHGLKYAFAGHAFDRLFSGYSTGYAGASDSQVAPYADHYFEYDSIQRVTKEVIKGDGSSTATVNRGTGAFTYVYSMMSANAPGPNSWRYKTLQTYPDNSRETIYANVYGEVMLKVFYDASTGITDLSFHKYDSAGRLILSASPSAVTGFDETKADLLNSVNGSYQYMNNLTGLVQITDYYTSTTATDTTPGGVAGYIQDTAVQVGQAGPKVLVDSTQYFAHSGGGATIYPRATHAVYRDGTNLATGMTTSYAYQWFSNSTRMQSQTVTKPTISSSQNGPGTADVTTTFYDSYGRPIWTRDPDGFLSYTAYDPATGAVVETVTDVNTNVVGFPTAPTGWTTPAGGGLHLITQMEVDNMGRTTKLTDPNGNVTYTVYNDANDEVRVYPRWQAATNTTTGPTQVSRWDAGNVYSETYTMSATPAVSGGRPTGAELPGNLQTLSRSYLNPAGQVVRKDDYFNLAGVNYSTADYIGAAGVNYYVTWTDYDVRGRANRTASPTGTITRTVYDGAGQPMSVWVGTNDTPASGTWSPTNNTAPANMVETMAYVFDNSVAGDNDVTKMIQYPGGGASARETDYFYSYRDRLVATKEGVQANEDATTHRPIVYYEYDSIGEVIAVDRYDGDGVTITTPSGQAFPSKPSASLLRAYSTTAFDDQQRPYANVVYSVNQSGGTISSTGLTTGTWYDHRGDVIETSQPGGLVTKNQYDGAGRVVKTFTTDGSGGSTWAAATSVTGDNVLSQTETQYDANGNAILSIDRERFDNETATGALGDPNTTPKARVSYAAMYYDAADRVTATADVGTNGGTAYTRPSTVPAASDTVLVTATVYNAAGWAQSVTDPRGIVTQTTYDNLGRTTKTIENYTNGAPTNFSNKTTEYTYDGSGHTLTVKADLPAGGYQTTQYVYGVSTVLGDPINSNDLLFEVNYPDPNTGDPNTSLHDQYGVDALGEVTSKTDRNGNNHAYTLDVLGRETSDSVAFYGQPVDTTVGELTIAYDAGGRPYLYTSYASPTGGTVVNQVRDIYNGLGQLITEYQSTSGAVNPSTTPKVQYAYTLMAGGVNNSRIVSMTYPNGRVLNYNYNTGVDNAISRFSSISDSSATLEQYTYLGLSTVVKRAHPQSGVDLTYIAQSGEPNGDAGDQYIGLDRFGRVVDQRWLNSSTGVATDEFTYGYDRDSNRLYRDNKVNSAFGELYHANGAANGYDNLGQLTAFARGTLSISSGNTVPDTVSMPAHSQSWILDALGNWSSVTTDGTTQARGYNKQNEITAITGQNPTAYDSNGNMTTDQTGKTLIYDAWNRLVQVKSGTTVLESYSYDALGRRISETPNGAPTKSLYYSSAWQVLEEDWSGAAQVQYVWSPVYIDAMVERDRNADGNTSTGPGGLEERFYVQQDATWNVTAIVNTSGAVQERYVYDPYGQPTILDATTNWNTRSASSFAWVYLHQGGRYDTGTGLYSFRNRDYSPTLGRWVELDPLGFRAGDVNLYRYVSDSPVNLLDPFGLDAKNVKVTISGEGDGFGGVETGKIVGIDSFAYGVKVRIEVDCGGDIQQATISQSIFQLITFSKGNRTVNLLSDGTHNNASLKPGEADSALKAWQNTKVADLSRMDDKGIAQNLYNPEVKNFRHGKNWVEYMDGVGFIGGEEEQRGGLPAKRWDSVELRFGIMVKAKGTDGSTSTKTFWRYQKGQSVNGVWTLVDEKQGTD
jgi:RHS repeat-associated protein